ncbi:MAG: NUDIX domain-containing protein [Streptosporangiaceae bacterium]
MPGANYQEPRLWHASLPGVVVAAAALIRDEVGCVLTVKPNYRDYWTLPGGICELGEPPHVGCSREVAEEVGLARAVGRLLSVDWQHSPADYGPQARPSMYFVFDGGVVGGQARIVLQDDELDAYRFTSPADLADFMSELGLRRATAALAALGCDGARYLPNDPD